VAREQRKARRERGRGYPAVLLALLALEFAWLAVAPVSRSTWLLENAPAVLLVALLVVTHRSFRFSRVSYTLLFVFLALHEVGAHYTYAEVPYDAFFQRAFGFSLDAALGFERNQFDRAIHFAYGLLLAYPIREIFLRVVAVRGFWGYALPLDVTMSTSMIYELIEWLVWAATESLTGDLGQSYLGTQGDVWDAHWDMALASLGAVVAMSITLAINRSLQRDFAAEWADSLRVKHDEPLGEEALAKMIEES
jgi:putative membrane protein